MNVNTYIYMCVLCVHQTPIELISNNMTSKMWNYRIYKQCLFDEQNSGIIVAITNWMYNCVNLFSSLTLPLSLYCCVCLCLYFHLFLVKSFVYFSASLTIRWYPFLIIFSLGFLNVEKLSNIVRNATIIVFWKFDTYYPLSHERRIL